MVENGTVNLGADLVATTLPFPLPGSSRARAGALVVVSHLGSPLQPGSDEVLASLASQAILSFELANVRSERDRLLISADRERIARDLHDLVIQRLFGAGLRLQGALSLIDSPAASARVSSTIDDLDATIKRSGKQYLPWRRPPVPACGPKSWKRWRMP